MKYKSFVNSLRCATIFLAATGMMCAAHIVSAQKGPDNSLRAAASYASTSSDCASDFNGDHKSDFAFFSPSTTEWVIQSSDGSAVFTAFGAAADTPVVADYDDDEMVDMAVARQDAGMWRWHIVQSSGAGVLDVDWGLDSDVPVQGDFDGDGKADLAVWRPADGVWYILASSTGEMLNVTCGLGADKVVPGDYDGDGATDCAVFRPSDQSFYYFSSADQAMHEQLWEQPYRNAYETLVPADYDGDGRTDFAIFNAEVGLWYIRESSSGNYRIESFEPNQSNCNPWEVPSCHVGDYPFPGDYDNDGKVDPAIWVYRGRVLIAKDNSGNTLKFTTETSEEMLPASAFFMTN